MPCSIEDKLLSPIEAGIPRRVSVIPPQSVAFSTSPIQTLPLTETLQKRIDNNEIYIIMYIVLGFQDLEEGKIASLVPI